MLDRPFGPRKKEKGMYSMKKNVYGLIYIIISILALLSVIFAFALYRYHFSGQIVLDSNEWSNFGSYYGGIVGPILSFFSIVLLVITVKLQEKALLQQKDEVDNSLEVIKENSKYLQKQIENNFQQMFESTFNTNLHQRFMIFDTFKTGNKEGSQIFREDIKHIITAYYNEHFAQIKTITIGGSDILKYIGLFNYIVNLAKTIKENNLSNNMEDHYFELLRYSLIESELLLLIIAKDIKELSVNYLDIISKILGEYNSISLSELAQSSTHSLFEVASRKGIIKISI